MLKDEFIQAIHDKKKVRVTFYSKDDRGYIVRKCAPMDYGPGRHPHKKNNRYHLWDYESDSGQHTLSLNPEQIKECEILDETFDPSELITWDTSWFVKRDWGIYS